MHENSDGNGNNHLRGYQVKHKFKGTLQKKKSQIVIREYTEQRQQQQQQGAKKCETNINGYSWKNRRQQHQQQWYGRMAPRTMHKSNDFRIVDLIQFKKEQYERKKCCRRHRCCCCLLFPNVNWSERIRNGKQ